MASPKPRPKVSEGKVYRTICPICEEQVETPDLTADKYFPFCSRRCKLLDLGKWFAGEYSLEREPDGEGEDE